MQASPPLPVGRAPSASTKVALALWSALVVAGLVAAMRYDWTPGAAATAPAHLPAVSTSAASSDESERFRLLVFAHPHCPCTTATIEQLGELLAAAPASLDCTVHFYSDPALGADWAHTELRSRADAIPRVELRDDPLGAIAQSFGAATSGQVLLYAPGGELRFSGGITASRGGRGLNVGSSAILRVLRGEPNDVASTPTFGCGLLAPAAQRASTTP